MIRWINEQLGTGAFDRVAQGDYNVIDVRELVDKDGNQSDTLRRMVEHVVNSLKSGRKTVVCCEFGISRSNSIAAAAWANFCNLPFDDALALVVKETGEQEIKIEMIASLRRAMEGAEQLDQRNIIITGANGTIGRPLIEALRPNMNAIAFSSSDGDLATSARELEAIVIREGVGQIIHLANPRVYSSPVALGQSLNMLKNVLDVCREHHLKLIYPSSWVVFSGYDSLALTVTEDMSLRPQGSYAEAKMLAENLIDHFVLAHDLPCLKLRYCSIYSSTSDKPRFLHTFIKKAIAGEEIISHRYKNGPPRMELLHMDDLIPVLSKIIQENLEGCYHIGGGGFHSTLDIARMIIDALKSTSRIRETTVNSFAPNIILDDRKLFRLPTFSGFAKRSVESGIRELLQHYQLKHS